MRIAPPHIELQSMPAGYCLHLLIRRDGHSSGNSNDTRFVTYDGRSLPSQQYRTYIKTVSDIFIYSRKDEGFKLTSPGSQRTLEGGSEALNLRRFSAWGTAVEATKLAAALEATTGSASFFLQTADRQPTELKNIYIKREPGDKIECGLWGKSDVTKQTAPLHAARVGCYQRQP